VAKGGRTSSIIKWRHVAVAKWEVSTPNPYCILTLCDNLAATAELTHTNGSMAIDVLNELWGRAPASRAASSHTKPWKDLSQAPLTIKLLGASWQPDY
jgi:hypothetical protein